MLAPGRHMEKNILAVVTETDAILDTTIKVYGGDQKFGSVHPMPAHCRVLL